MSDKDKLEHQWRKIIEVIDIAKTNNPYYKDLLQDIEINSWRDFEKIPFLTKEIIRKNLKNLQHISYVNKDEVYANSSGGSTGEPVTFYQTKEYANRAKASFYYANYLNGVTPYDKTLILWGAVRDMHNPTKRSLFRRVKDFLSNQRMLNTFVMNDQIIREYINTMNQFGPKFIKAYVHSIYEIAKYINQNNIKIKFKPIIQTTTGPLYPEVREEIERAFNRAHVFNYYGSREVSSIASEVIGKDGLQVMYDNIFVEIIGSDGKPVNKGEEGEIVVTSLNNHYMPLIRFKIGDRAIKGDNNSFGTLVLKSVLGRTLGVIYRHDGSYIDGQFFTSLFFNNPGVEKFQLIQRSLSKAELKIIKSSKFDLESFEKILIQIQTELPGIEILVKEVDQIEVSATGKIMYVYSDLQR